MTYTTEEKRMIAELRHKSEMNTIAFVEEAKNEYNRAAANHKATLTQKVDECVLEGKNRLEVAITAALEKIRSDETEMMKSHYI